MAREEFTRPVSAADTHDIRLCESFQWTLHWPFASSLFPQLPDQLPDQLPQLPDLFQLQIQTACSSHRYPRPMTFQCTCIHYWAHLQVLSIPENSKQQFPETLTFVSYLIDHVALHNVTCI